MLEITSGPVKAVAVSHDGQTTALARRGPGEVVGTGRRSVTIRDVDRLRLWPDR